MILASMYILKSDCVNGISVYTYTSAVGVQYQQRNYVIKGRTKRKKKCTLKKESLYDYLKKKLNFQNESSFKSNASLTAINYNIQPNVDKNVICISPRHYRYKLHIAKKIYI